MASNNTQFFQNQRTYANEQFVGSNGGVSGGVSGAVKGANLSGKADIIRAVGDVAGLAATTIAGISDQNKRLTYEKNLDSLTADQQKALNIALLSANTESERMKLIAETLSNLQSKRIDLLTAKVSEDERKKRTNLIISASIIGVIAIGIIAIIVVKK
jgi:hypothetical protein